MKRIKFKLIGDGALLLAADTLADPLNPLTKAHKELTSKRLKTDEELLAIARSQWRGMLYHDDELGVYMPTANIRAALVGGGKLNKLGMQIKRGITITEDKVPIDYGKKLTPEELWDQKYTDIRSVVVSQSRVMCYRPCFKQWSLIFSLTFDEQVLDENQIVLALDNAGQFIGIGGYRPEKGGTFGRFKVEKLKVEKVK